MGVNRINVNSTDSNYTHSIFDISEYTGRSYDTLSDALADIPKEKQTGGMSIKYVDSNNNNNKYVQWKLTFNYFSINISDWIQYDSVYTEGQTDSDLDISDEYGNSLVRFENGDIKTKNFDSSQVVTKLNTIEQGAEANDVFTIQDFSDLTIGDEQSNILCEFYDGHIRTKNFNSKNIDIHNRYEERPSSGKVCFSVKVNINIVSSAQTADVLDQYVEGTDYGYLYLPVNYSPTDKPVPLIICCHGASAAKNSYTSPVAEAGIWSYWIRLGYAIMDMYGIPYEQSGIPGSSSADNSELHYGNPVTIQCYKKGYEWVKEHYNIQDGIFVIGASMGGMSSVQIIQSGLFPVRAYVGFCPCIETFKQAYCNPWSSGTFQRSKIAQYFNFEGTAPTWTNTKPPTQDEINYFKSNLQKVIGYYPIFKNSVGGNIADVFNFIPNPIGENNDFENTIQQEQEFYNQFSITISCPVKVFHCINDGVVAYRYSKYWVEMLKRGGQIAYLRTFPSGGHNAWSQGNSTTIKDISGFDLTLKASEYEAYLFCERFKIN